MKHSFNVQILAFLDQNKLTTIKKEMKNCFMFEEYFY